MSQDKILIDLDSKHRNRNEFPDVFDFSIPFENTRIVRDKNNSNDPISNSYPDIEWQWNSKPPITILCNSFGYSTSTNVSVIGGSGSGMTVDIIADGFLPMASSIPSRTHLKYNTIDEHAGRELTPVNSIIDTNYAFETDGDSTITGVGTGFVNDNNFSNFSATGLGLFASGTTLTVSIIECTNGGVETFTISSAGTNYSVGDKGIIYSTTSHSYPDDANKVGTFVVKTIGGGGSVTSIDILSPGEDYTAGHTAILRLAGDSNAQITIDTITSIGTNHPEGKIQAIYLNTTDISGSGFVEGDYISLTSPDTISGTNHEYKILNTGLCHSGSVHKITINKSGHGYIPGETLSLASMTANNFGFVIKDLGTGYKNNDGINTFTISTAGTGYSVGNVGTLLGDFNAISSATYRVSTIGGGGSVTGVELLNIGKGHNVGEILTLTGSGGGNAQITINSVYDNTRSTIGGTGSGLTVDYTIGVGTISTFEINNQGTGYVDGDELDMLGHDTLTTVAFDFTGDVDGEDVFEKTNHNLETGMFVAITAGTIPAANTQFSLNTKYYVIKVNANKFQLALPSSPTVKIEGSADMTNLTITLVTGPTFILQNCKFRIGESFDCNMDTHFTTDSTETLLTATSTSGVGTGMQIKLANINRVSEDTWTYDETGGSLEDLWTTGNTSFNLSVGDGVVFIKAGGAATNYNINTNYFITSVSNREVTLSYTKGGAVIEGTGDSYTGWDSSSIENVIECIYNTGTGYEIGDTVTFRDKYSNSFTITLTNKNIKGASLENDNFISDNGIRAFNENQIFINDGVTQNLHVFDNFYKGLIFENTTQSVRSRITNYDHTNSIITLEHHIPITITDSWKIVNPTTKNKIFIPGGSDNSDDYVGHYYQAQMFTGNSYTNNNASSKVVSDNRVITQFRKIISYDQITKMATLETPLHSFTNCANQMSIQQDIVLSNQENNPSTRFYKEGGGSFSTFSKTTLRNVSPTNYSGNASDVKLNGSGSGYQLSHLWSLYLGKNTKVEDYTDWRYRYSLGENYKMFETVRYTVTDDTSTDTVISILFTRLLLKGVKGSISFNRIRKILPVIPQNNESIIPGIITSSNSSINIYKNHRMLSQVNIKDGGSGFRNGDQIILFPSAIVQNLIDAFPNFVQDFVLNNILNGETLNGITILEVVSVNAGVIQELNIKMTYPFDANQTFYPNFEPSLWNDIEIPDMSLVTATTYPDESKLLNTVSFYSFVMDSNYYDNPSQSVLNTNAKGAILEIIKFDNISFMPLKLNEDKLQEDTVENTFKYIPYYNNIGGSSLYESQNKYLTYRHKYSSTSLNIKSLDNALNYKKLTIPQIFYHTFSSKKYVSSLNFSVTHLLGGEIYYGETGGTLPTSSENNILNSQQVTNKLVINYGENYSQYRFLNTTTSDTILKSKTFNPLQFIINKIALSGPIGMTGMDNFLEIFPAFLISNNDDLLNINDTPFELLPFTTDNSSSFVHNREIQINKGLFTITLNHLIIPNLLRYCLAKKLKYILVEFSNEETVNQTVYSSNNDKLRNVIFKCYLSTNYNSSDDFAHFVSNDIHHIVFNINNDIRIKINDEDGNLLHPFNKESCLIKKPNKDIQFTAMFNLSVIRNKSSNAEINNTKLLEKITQNQQLIITNLTQKSSKSSKKGKTSKPSVSGNFIKNGTNTFMKKPGQTDIDLDINYSSLQNDIPSENDISLQTNKLSIINTLKNDLSLRNKQQINELRNTLIENYEDQQEYDQQQYNEEQEYDQQYNDQQYNDQEYNEQYNEEQEYNEQYNDQQYNEQYNEEQQQYLRQQNYNQQEQYFDEEQYFNQDYD